MAIFEVLLGSVNMTGMGPLVPVRRCPRYGSLAPDGGRHGAPFGRELLVYLRQILHRRYLLARAGPPRPDW